MTTSHIDSEYQASAIEPQVQQDWDNRKVFKVADTVEGKHRYILSMFPYPSRNCIWDMCVTTPLVT